MKQFTVKDFITYNNPCFSCGNKVSIKIGVEAINLPASSYSSYIRSNIASDKTEIDLKVTYRDVLQLWIFHKSNKILSSDSRGLTDYLLSNKLLLSSHCDKCFTFIYTNSLEFNLEKGYVKPVELNYESIYLQDGEKNYSLINHFSLNKTILQVRDLSKPKDYLFDNNQIELPLTPLYKFKNREHLLNKLKTFITFS